jgi:hypothetical protein
VNQIRQKGDRSRKRKHDALGHGGDRKNYQRQRYRPDASPRADDRRIDATVRMTMPLSMVVTMFRSVVVLDVLGNDRFGYVHR